MEKRLYGVTLKLTGDEAETLADAAGKLGMDVETLLSGIVEDIHRGQGDEGLLLREYLERKEEPGASFVAFCYRNGYAVDFLEYVSNEIAEREEYMKELEGAEEDPSELESEKEYIAATLAEKAEVWEAYLKEAGVFALSEEEAIKEARRWEDKSSSFRGGWRRL